MNISETIIYIDINDNGQVTHMVGTCKARDFRKPKNLKEVCEQTGIRYYES